MYLSYSSQISSVTVQGLPQGYAEVPLLCYHGCFANFFLKHATSPILPLSPYTDNKKGQFLTGKVSCSCLFKTLQRHVQQGAGAVASLNLVILQVPFFLGYFICSYLGLPAV